MKNIKEKFIQALIDELNDVNKKERIYHNKPPLNVCFMVSVVDQHIDKYKEFMEELTKNRWCINGYEEDNSGGYTNGKIRILIEKPEEEKESDYLIDAFENYCYYIEFRYDERYWGYCECTPKDEGYNEKHKCCGNGCDWKAPSFYLTKEINLGGYSWEGLERDYWEYEEKFYQKEENKNKEVEEYNKQKKINSLKEQIKELQDELNKLTN